MPLTLLLRGRQAEKSSNSASVIGERSGSSQGLGDEVVADLVEV